MEHVWMRMCHLHFVPNSQVSAASARSAYKSLFFAAHLCRAARSTLCNVAVYSDAASETRVYTYNVHIDAAHKGTTTPRLMQNKDAGTMTWLTSPYLNDITVFHSSCCSMRNARRFPNSSRRRVMLGHESAEYVNDYVPTPPLEGAIYLRRSDGARALLGRFDASCFSVPWEGCGGALTGEHDSRCGEASEDPSVYYAPFFRQPLVRKIFFGDSEWRLCLRVEVQYSKRHPERGGWMADLQMDLSPERWETVDRAKMASPLARESFYKALNSLLEWS